jgi:hypothetical protein
MCCAANKEHGTPNGVRGLARLTSINMELLTEFRLQRRVGLRATFIFSNELGTMIAHARIHQAEMRPVVRFHFLPRLRDGIFCSIN